MIRKIKTFLLTREPFKPMHVGNWLRGVYLKKYFSKYLTANQLVLDAGCGNGRHTKVLSDMFPEAKFEGTDIKSFPEWQTFTSSHVSFRVEDATNLSTTEHHDVVVSIDMIEHIKNNERVLQSFYRTLKKGGWMYLCVPCGSNETYFFSEKYYQRFREWEAIEHIGEQRDLPELKKILIDMGFTIHLARYNFTAFGHLAWELEFIFQTTPWGRRLNVLLMPLYKILGLLDIYVPIGKGGNVLIVQKI